MQWHTPSRWFANGEIDVRLFVAFGVLLSPQNQLKWRKLRKDHLRPVDLRVTSRTESEHQMQQRLARFPMMDSGIGITAHPAGVSIARLDLPWGIPFLGSLEKRVESRSGAVIQHAAN